MDKVNTERWVTEAPLDLDALLAETDDPACGGLVVFCGTVREQNEGRPVDGMTYEAHVSMAAKVIREIEDEILAMPGVRQCRIMHRTGALKLTEVSVIVVVRAPHRGAAFEAARYGIDAVKERTPIWKEEHYTDGGSKYLDGTPLVQPETETL